MKAFSLAFGMVMLLAGCITSPELKEVGTMKITSPAFQNMGMMPVSFTCEGENINPVLKLEGTPDATKSLALIVDDPDAPSKVWVHWIVWNIQPETNEIGEGAKIGIEGKNDMNELGYDGPCPPPGSPHRYRFTVYALDKMLELPAGSTRAQLDNAMNGHVLASAELIGKFGR